MNSAKDYVANYLQQLREGQYESAFFNLIEGRREVVPLLIEAFDKGENRDFRAQLVQCIWQIRLPETIGFLAGVLHDLEPAVWKEALDGLVALRGSEAVKALEKARIVISARPGPGVTLEWIDEALQQLRESQGS